jgi:hypothetical protein
MRTIGWCYSIHYVMLTKLPLMEHRKFAMSPRRDTRTGIIHYGNRLFVTLFVALRLHVCPYCLHTSASMKKPACAPFRRCFRMHSRCTMPLNRVPCCMPPQKELLSSFLVRYFRKPLSSPARPNAPGPASERLPYHQIHTFSRHYSQFLCPLPSGRTAQYICM